MLPLTKLVKGCFTKVRVAHKQWKNEFSVWVVSARRTKAEIVKCKTKQRTCYWAAVSAV